MAGATLCKPEIFSQGQWQLYPSREPLPENLGSCFSMRSRRTLTRETEGDGAPGIKERVGRTYCYLDLPPCLLQEGTELGGSLPCMDRDFLNRKSQNNS